VLYGTRTYLVHVKVDLALHQAISFANESAELPAPLSDEASRLVRFLALIVPRPANRFAAGTPLLSLASDGSYRRAIGCLLWGRYGEAVRYLESIPRDRRDGQAWIALAVAHIALDGGANEHDHILEAFAASDYALKVAPAAAETYFVRATLLDRIGLSSWAGTSWRRYLASAEAPRWRDIARRHLVVPRPNDSTSWTANTSHLDKLTTSDLAALSARSPQQARTYAESVYLAEWADAITAGRDDEATAALRRILAIAGSLQARTGESLLLDVASTIEKSDAHARTITAEAIDRYRTGRFAVRDAHPAEAIPYLMRARRYFASVGSPMAALADCYVAIALVDQNRTAEARRRLVALIAAEKRSRSKHHALIAFALYHAALCDVTEGNWSDALAEAEESLAIFQRLGETGFAGTVEALISECYDFLGQRRQSWQHGLNAIGLLVAWGDLNRARSMLAGLSHAELRRKEWDHARAIAEVERRMALGVPAPRLDSDMFLRLAVADFRRGDVAGSQHDLADARGAVSHLDDAVRAKLVADIDAVTGSIMRHEKPMPALALLSSAIAFQEGAGRTIMLPPLYLERAQLFEAIGRLDDAQRDYERGIALLERQRDRTSRRELRSGIFGEGDDLFRDAVRLALARGMPSMALRIIERGRARAVAEEMATREGEFHSLLTSDPVGDLALSLESNQLLVEYEFLDGELAILVLQRNGMTFSKVRVRREILEHEVSAMVDALVHRRPLGDVESSAAVLFDRLLAPIREQLSQKTSIVIVPDVMLQQVPFAALLDRADQKFVIETHFMTTAPSATVYAASRRRIARVGSGDRPSRAAIYAAPSLVGGKFQDLPLLPISEEEGKRVASAYRHSLLLTGSQVTVSRFNASATAYDVIGFAGHSIIRPAEPWHSALLLSPSNDDGLLSVERIARMSFKRTRVAVLASCSTLQGQLGAIDGEPGVSRAFLMAGIPSVIGTLWDVDDGEVGPFVVGLHRKLAAGVAPAEALRTEQLEALRGSIAERRHPGYWSAFALVGASR
jgi:CHAT domain-containing protein